MRVYSTQELQHIEATGQWNPALYGGEDGWREMVDQYHAAAKCAGCKKVLIDDARYCWHCGADREDLFGRILATDPETIEPMPKPTHWWSKDLAAEARRLAKELFGTQTGIRVRMARGSSYIHVDLPNDHEWGKPGHDACGYNATTFGAPSRQCHYCDRRKAAAHRFEAILVARMPWTSNKSDTMRDYFDFTWICY